MSLLLEVFDLNGDMFEVIPSVAKSLVINHGWSLEKTVASNAISEWKVVVEKITAEDPVEEPIVDSDTHAL